MKVKQLITYASILLQFMLFTYSIAFPTLYTGMRINIIANDNNKYVSIDNSTSYLVANNAMQEEFIVINNNDGTYSFQSVRNNCYVCADYGTSPTNYVDANRTALGVWEKFIVINQGGNVFSLQGYTGTYVTADISLSSPFLVANRTSIGPWEKFTMTVVTFGLPKKLDLATWAISYQSGNSCNLATLGTALNTRDAFHVGLTSNISNHYPSIMSTWSCQFNDGNATLESFQAPTKNTCEFVFFVGHGYDGGNCPIFLNNTSCEYSYNNFTVGGAFTKWSFFDACNVLRDRTASDYLPMFNGAHAIFGFQSNNFYWSWKSDWWQCTWYGCDYTNNWDQETYFFNNWFSGQNMWTAYSNAITQNYNHANTSYFHGNISGYEYATVQITGQALDNNGNWQTVSGAYESITNTFKNQMPTYTVGPGWNYQGISYISTVIGTPVYN